MSRGAAPGALPRLHVLTAAAPDEQVLRDLDAVLGARAPCVQLRAKGRTDRALLLLAEQVVERCRSAGAWCIVDDRVDVALAVGADGVHVGAEDLPVAAVRRVAGDRLVVGGTARDPDTARRLEAAGADYLGVGPTYATTTKAGLPAPLGTSGVAAVAAAVTVPVVAIAGITADRVREVLDAGAHGVAVIGAVADAPDPGEATAALLARLTDARAAGGAP